MNVSNRENRRVTPKNCPRTAPSQDRRPAGACGSGSKPSRFAAIVLVACTTCLFGSTRARADEPSSLSVASAIEQALVDAIARAERSVVSIARVSRDDTPEISLRDRRPNPFGFRAGMFMDEPSPGDPAFIPNDFGTGIVLSKEGLILTNFHVVDPDSDHYVSTMDRKVFRATIKAADSRSDLAVLQVDDGVHEGNFEPMPLGDGGRVRKGQIVIALGNPYAIARDGQVSASWGIVANVARKSPASPTTDWEASKADETIHQFGTLIQTDARLNLGTSGGALVDFKGDMVGLTTSIAALSGYEQPAGYAIPVDDLFRRIVDALSKGKEVEYGFLGIHTSNLSLEDRRGGAHGVRVERVVRGTAALRAQLNTEDVILAIGGVPIHDTNELMLQIGRHAAGEDVTLLVDRKDQQVNLHATLTKYPGHGKRIMTAGISRWRGLRVDYPTARPVLMPDPSGYHDGVWVVEVEEGSPAWTAGLRPDMHISHVGNTRVMTPSEFHRETLDKAGPIPLKVVIENSFGEETVRVIPES